MRAPQKTFCRKWYAIPPWCLQTFIWPATRFLFRFFARWEIYGLQENVLPLKGPVIFAANHSSETDVFMVPAALPFLSKFMPIFYVSRAEPGFYKKTGWKQYLYGGTFFKLWGAYPVYSGYKDYNRSLVNHIDIANHGYSIFFYPEGKRSKDIETNKVHGGVAYLAYITGTPIVPVLIKGNYNIKISSFFKRNVKIETRFGVPRYPQEFFLDEPIVNQQRNDFVRASQRIMQDIAAMNEASQ